MPTEKIDKAKNQPKYRQLRDIIASGIRDGEYPVGTLLPPEREIEKKFSVSRVTVRLAIKELFAKGYLDKGPGLRALIANTAPAATRATREYANMAFVSQRAFEGALCVYRSLYEAIMRECYAKETRLFYVNAGKPIPDFIRETRFSAIFIAGDEMARRGAASLACQGTRLVSIDDNTWEEGVWIVGSDNYQCGQLAAERLIARKRVRPLFIGNKHGYGYQPFNERKNGFINRFAKEGVACGLFDVGMDRSGVFDSKELLDFLLTSDCDGIFAHHDLLAIEVLNALASLNRRVPEDVAVIGMDGTDAGALTRPPLTSIAQPIAAIARLAVAEALSEESKPRRTLLPGSLLERSSG